ncbi:MAG: Lrp/AsnC ligand binding domain-containing protein [Promethearchaeota archaeon]
MVLACILVNCKRGEFSGVVEEIKSFEGVKSAFSTPGRWDVVVEVETTDLKSLTEVSLKINGLGGVRATETLVEADIEN